MLTREMWWIVRTPDGVVAEAYETRVRSARCPAIDWAEDPEGMAFFEDMAAIGDVIRRAR